MSDDVNNEYFSDGISEELLKLLAKIPELRVISRSSAFAYKGKDIDIPTVAAQLNVAHVLEGSVRKAGNEVRITAQLIEARSDTHLWSETYGRTIDNIFVTQDEIAAKVVEQLKVTLLDDTPTVQATDPEAYALVPQARYLFQQQSSDALEKSIALSEQALAHHALGQAAASDAVLEELVEKYDQDAAYNDPRWLPFLESIGKSPEQLATIEFKVALPE